MLKAQFFDCREGSVEALGLVAMQFGSQSSTARRGLQEENDPPSTIEEEISIPFEMAYKEPAEAAAKGLFGLTMIGQDESSRSAYIAILVLLVINVLSLIMLIAQHNRFKGSKLYLR
jgi:hypothetical protein